MTQYRIFTQPTTEETAQCRGRLPVRPLAMIVACQWYLWLAAHESAGRVFILDDDGNPIVELG